MVSINPYQFILSFSLPWLTFLVNSAASISSTHFNETAGSFNYFPARVEIKLRRYSMPDTHRRTWVNREFLMTTGNLAKFLVYVHPDSPRSTKVRFQIWRPIADEMSSSTLQLVYEYPFILPYQGGPYTINIPDRPLISSPSYFGWTYEEGVDPISHETAPGYPEYVHTFFSSDSLPRVGDTLQFADFMANYRHSIGVAIDVGK